MMNTIASLPFNDKFKRLFSLRQEAEFDTFSFTHEQKDITLFHLREDFIPQQVRKFNTFYEAQFLHTLAFFWDQKGCIFDIGANIGNHSLWFAKIMGANVWSFEPVEVNALTLSINLEMNHVSDRARLFHLALDNQPGELVMSMAMSGNMGTWSALAQENEHSVRVPKMMLDTLVDQASPGTPVSLIKVDVEGMEKNVLEGAAQTILRDKPVLALESANMDEFRQLEVLLTEWGYFPAEVMNHTPTFIWLNVHNPHHLEKLVGYVRHKTLMKRQNNYPA